MKTATLAVRSAAITALCAMALAFVAAPTIAAEPVKLRLGFPNPITNPNAKMTQELLDELRTRSDGRLDIELIDNTAAGFKPADSFRVIKQGINQMGYLIRTYMMRDEPLLQALVPHGALVTPEENEKINEIQNEILDDILRRKWNLTLISPVWLSDVVDMVLITKKPVNTLEDLKGLKVRYWNRIGIEALNSLGAAAQTLPLGETYVGLKTGVIDGAVSVRRAAYTLSWYEVAPYYTYFHGFATGGNHAIIADIDTWNKVPADLQQMFRDVFAERMAKNKAKWKARTLEIKYQQLLAEKGVTEGTGLTKADYERVRGEFLKSWRKQVEEVGPEAVKIYEKLVAALTGS